MIINMSFEVPDVISPAKLAQYIREQADNAAGQLELHIINVPEVDESIQIDYQDEWDTKLFRSE